MRPLSTLQAKHDGLEDKQTHARCPTYSHPYQQTRSKQRAHLVRGGFRQENIFLKQQNINMLLFARLLFRCWNDFSN